MLTGRRDTDQIECMTRLNRIASALPLIVLCLVGCGRTSQNGGASSSNAPSAVSVSPPSITVDAGSTTTFTAAFAPSLPLGGSLTWAVNPPSGGTITSAGFYTASGTAGNYTIVATWTSSDPAAGMSVSGSATVKVRAPLQPDAELNTNFVQASGAIQLSGKIQNSAVVGQTVPFAVQTEPNGSVQISTGFTIPVVCAVSDTSCH